jgi:hypothetical protein
MNPLTLIRHEGATPRASSTYQQQAAAASQTSLVPDMTDRDFYPVIEPLHSQAS